LEVDDELAFVEAFEALSTMRLAGFAGAGGSAPTGAPCGVPK
jgi:hypothetical protein